MPMVFLKENLIIFLGFFSKIYIFFFFCKITTYSGMGSSGTNSRLFFGWSDPFHWIRNVYSGATVYVPDRDFEYNLRRQLHSEKAHSDYDAPTRLQRSNSILTCIDTHIQHGRRELQPCYFTGMFFVFSLFV